MPRPSRCRRIARALLVAALAYGCGDAGEQPGRDAANATEWRSWGSDPGSSRFSSATRIDASNFSRLERAWSWTSAAVAWKKEVVEAAASKRKLPYKVSPQVVISDFQTTPLMVDGVLYGSTNIGQVFALDARTGRELWVHDPKAYLSARFMNFHFAKHRGVTWWRDGDDERIFIPTNDAFLVALDAKTGTPVPEFGEDGRVDLLVGLRGPKPRRLNDYFQSSPAAIYRDTLIVGGSVTDRPQTPRSIPGDIRGYDARTGALRWTFHVVPAEGEPGTETWEDDSWRYSGAANVWGPISVDPDLGRVYLATSTPTNDLYGGHRLGDDLYAETLLCLDAQTGERIWHFQMTHHGLWDYDPAAPPNLVDITVDGREIRAVAQVTKQGFTFVFDRVTGEPVWPIEERPVPPSDVPGERAAATQPFPTKPPPFERQGAFEEDLIDFTPELRAQALEAFRSYRTGPLFTPPSLEGTLILPGPAGGANWQGAGVDPTRGVLYVPSVTMPAVMSVKPGEPGSGFRYVTDQSRPVWFPLDVPRRLGLPIFKPPWSRITAIDLNRGEILWQTPNGDGLREDPRFAGLDLPPLGTGARACLLVTPTLVVAGEGSELWIKHLGGPFLHAYDKDTGERVGTVKLPARTRGCPMTYELEGRQYLAVTVADDDVDPQLWVLTTP